MNSWWTKTVKILSYDLKNNYHDKGLLHGHICPEYVLRDDHRGLILIRPPKDEKETTTTTTVVTCHPDILNTMIVTKYEHDWYALFVTGIYLMTNLFFNNPETPLSDSRVLQNKIDFFTSVELSRLSIDDDVKNAITFLNFVYKGLIIL